MNIDSGAQEGGRSFFPKEINLQMNPDRVDSRLMDNSKKIEPSKNCKELPTNPKSCIRIENSQFSEGHCPRKVASNAVERTSSSGFFFVQGEKTGVVNQTQTGRKVSEAARFVLQRRGIGGFSDGFQAGQFMLSEPSVFTSGWLL